MGPTGTRRDLCGLVWLSGAFLALPTLASPSLVWPPFLGASFLASSSLPGMGRTTWWASFWAGFFFVCLGAHVKLPVPPCLGVGEPDGRQRCMPVSRARLSRSLSQLASPVGNFPRLPTLMATTEESQRCSPVGGGVSSSMSGPAFSVPDHQMWSAWRLGRPRRSRCHWRPSSGSQCTGRPRHRHEAAWPAWAF